MAKINTLILGCGPNWPKRNTPIHKDVFLDILPFPGVDIPHNLNNLPWPIQDNEFKCVAAIHVVEHLDSLIDFMNECHRIITPGGSLYIITPEAGSDYDLTHADPTHVRCYRRHTFINYFTLGEMEKFGYTDKAWSILDLRVVNNCIKTLMTPIKTKIDQEILDDYNKN